VPGLLVLRCGARAIEAGGNQGSNNSRRRPAARTTSGAEARPDILTGLDERAAGLIAALV